jgi:hypothetical protein
MSNQYRSNWQFCSTKEVIGIHEVIFPYNWELDLEMNPDFKEWTTEYVEGVKIKWQKGA